MRPAGQPREPAPRGFLDEKPAQVAIELVRPQATAALVVGDEEVGPSVTGGVGPERAVAAGQGGGHARRCGDVGKRQHSCGRRLHLLRRDHSARRRPEEHRGRKNNEPRRQQAAGNRSGMHAVL